MGNDTRRKLEEELLAGYATPGDPMYAAPFETAPDDGVSFDKQPFLPYAFTPAGVGKMAMGLPGAAASMVYEPYQALKRLLSEEGQYRPGSGDTKPIEDATNVAGAVMLPGLGLNAAGMVPKNAVGIFGGRLAKTADQAALAKAEEMAAGGAGRDEIWSATGWYLGPDKKWRFEIPDERSYAKDTVGPDGWEKGVGRLPDYIGHRDLYKAYPKAQDTQVLTGGPPGGSFSGNWADYRPGEGALMRIGDMGGALDRRRIALHEIQHGVQREEGFAPGWNPEDAAMPAMQAITQRMNQIARDLDQYRIPGSDKFKDPRGQQLYDEYMRLMSERGKVSGKDLYHRTSGEVEARNVMKRADMTPEERRATPPWQTQDVPDMEQILRENYGSGGPQMSIEDLMKLYRGESAYNKKGGPYWTPDREWSRQFTQSGLDKEIREANIKRTDVYKPPDPVYAGDPDAIDKIVKEARGAGFKAVQLDEGAGQPPSIYVFDRKALAAPQRLKNLKK